MEEFGEEPARIVAAMVNPPGPAPEAETVTLLNASPDPIDLTGWGLVDRGMHTGAVPASVLAAGATVVVPLDPTLQLGNHGGEITLLDAAGLKVHGVSYTAPQAERSGWTIVRRADTASSRRRRRPSSPKARTTTRPRRSWWRK